MSEYYAFQSVFVGQLAVVIGCTAASWSSPMLPKLQNTTDNPLGRVITSTEYSLLGSLELFSACLGSIIYGLLSKKIGRKPLMISMGLISMVFYLIMAWATDIGIFYLCRFATGLTFGASSTIIPLYSAELARTETRGILCMSMAIFMNIGILIPNSLGPFIPMFWFHIILAAVAAIYIPAIAFLSFESPHFLVHKNYPEAERILKKLRGQFYDEKELKELKMDIERSKMVSVKTIIKNKDFLKTFAMVLGLCTFMSLTGTGVIAGFTQPIFDMAGENSISSSISTIIIGITQLIATIIMSIIADRFPRKSLLISSYLGLVLVEIILGAFYVMHDRNIEMVNSMRWLPLLCLMLIVILYNVGAGPVTFTLIGEVFSAESKEVATSLIVVYNFVLVWIVSIIFKSWVDFIGIGYLFGIFGCSCLLGAIFVFFFVIETKGKTLMEIQQTLKER